MSRSFYYYIMTTDNGGAPCCTPGMWSLAICKPSIRRKADERDVVIGFAGKKIDPSGKLGVVHVAMVTKKLSEGAYYELDSKYGKRADCIYSKGPRGFSRRANPFHGRGDMDRDLGRRRDNASVLLSGRFRYFGSRQYAVDWTQYPHLHECVLALRQGHRVNHHPHVLRDIERLYKEMLATKYTLGTPTQSVRAKCDTDDNFCTC
jgi:hypothetical protein